MEPLGARVGTFRPRHHVRAGPRRRHRARLTRPLRRGRAQDPAAHDIAGANGAEKMLETRRYRGLVDWLEPDWFRVMAKLVTFNPPTTAPHPRVRRARHQAEPAAEHHVELIAFKYRMIHEQLQVLNAGKTLERPG